MSSSLKNKVSRFIEKDKLLIRNKTYIVALSGGADSIALSLVLRELGYSFHAVHCNFHLRGNESDRDEQFVKTFTQEKNIPLHLVHFDTREYASLHHLSIETAARKLRYNYFENLRRDIGAEGIVVAHHRDDNVETVLMNLVRGTGLNGMQGIIPVNGRIIRPLLCACRNEIEEYLSQIEQEYVTDSTNLDTDATRNKFRLDILPVLKEVNPNVSNNIDMASHYFKEIKKVVDQVISDAKKEIIKEANNCIQIDIPSLMRFPSPSFLLFEICRNFGYTSAQVEEIFAAIDGQSGKIFHSATNELLIDRKTIIIEKERQNTPKIIIPECGVYIVEDVKLRLYTKQIETNNFEIVKRDNKVCIDSASVKFPLLVRPVNNGDRFIPFGMKGSKLISDYLTDKKKNLFEKRRQLVIEDNNGTIVWLIGERISDRCKISLRSKEAIFIELIK